MADKKPIDREYLLAQLENFARLIGSNFVAKDSDEIAQIATNTSAISALQAGSGGSSTDGVTEARVNQLIKTKIDSLINGADEHYDTFKEIADWIIATGQTVENKATKIDYDPETKELTLYAGTRPLNSTYVDASESTSNFFIPPEFGLEWEDEKMYGHLMMVGGRGAIFSIDPVTGHLLEGEGA